MKKQQLAILPLTLALMFACKKKDGKVKGYEPVYEDTAALQAVTYQPQGQAVENGGKIYILGDTLYQVETDKGIHIINISDKADIKNTGFISIKGCREVAANGRTIFTNNYTELLALRMTGSGVVVVKRSPEMTLTGNVSSMPPERGYFTCPVNIPGKQITGWRKAELIEPKCFF